MPRIIVKPILPDKKLPTTYATNTSSASSNYSIIDAAAMNASLNCSPTSRTSSSRRIQQQQQAKAAAAAAAAAAATAAALNSTTSATATTQASTMREVLASIPGFSMKPRRRSSKKMSTAAQIEQTKDGKIDLETPDSILASTNLRALLNKQTFSMLPPLYQYNLIQLLPSVDRQAIDAEQKPLPNTAVATPTQPTDAIVLGPSSLNNEFFARACLEWRERLAEGEFTPENQMKLKTEAEKEKNKLDPWKLKHFEPIWGEKSFNRASTSRACAVESSLKLEKEQQKYVECTIIGQETAAAAATTPNPTTPSPTVKSESTSSASNLVKNEALTSSTPTCSSPLSSSISTVSPTSVPAEDVAVTCSTKIAAFEHRNELKLSIKKEYDQKTDIKDKSMVSF